MDSAPKKLDVVDKWRARVLFRDPPAAGDVSWTKRIERQMAVLRVSFPFLTEKQLRGKAWSACGLRSLMGELPRSGLTPRVKKEFMKRRKDTGFNMSPKSNINREPNHASDKKEAEILSYSCIFNNSGIEVLIPQDKVILNVPPQTPLNSKNSANLLPINEVLSISNLETLKQRRVKRKLKPKKVNFDTQEHPSIINFVIPCDGQLSQSEAPEISWNESDSSVKFNNLHLSQVYKANLEIEPSSSWKDKYTVPTISDCSTTAQSEKNKTDTKAVEQNVISNGSISSSLPPTPLNYWSKRVEQSDTSQGTIKCTPIMNTDQEDSLIILVDKYQTNEKSLENQQVMESSPTSLSIKCEDSFYQDSNYSFDSLLDRELKSQEYQIFNNKLSENYSLPSTPQEPLMTAPFLSNLCCEYDKACSKKEYKPESYIICNNIVQNLKEDCDKIIPPEVPLQKYFEAEEKSFEEIESEVKQKVNSIIIALEEDKSTE